MDKIVFDYYVRKISRLLERAEKCTPPREKIALIKAARKTNAALRNAYSNSSSLSTDGGPGSGNYGHKGVPGQVGGSAKGTGGGVETISSVAAEIPKPKNITSPEDMIAQTSKPFFEKIGYSKKPTVVSDDEFQSAESDYPVQYRGIDYHGSFESFVGDDYFVGNGANGDGTNTASDRKIAERYAEDNGAIIKIKLDKSAKVVTVKELIGKMGEFRDAKAPEGVDPLVFDHLSSDPGCIAASLGYDAIYDDVNKWLNIVNRGKMIVSSDYERT